MFLAAAPYFQSRFADNQKILTNFQAAITSVSTVTNFSSLLLLTNFQSKASYTKRIIWSLVLNICVFSLLAVSTTYFRDVSSTGYLIFTLIMVFCSSIGTGLCGNGAFAFAASFGRPEYLQALMTGQAIAGVLPSVAQILSVLAFPDPDNLVGAGAEASALAKENTMSALIYFLTACGVSALCLICVLPLVRKHNQALENQKLATMTSLEPTQDTGRKSISIWVLYKKLHWLAAAVIVSFSVSMFFPVFTQKIVSIVPVDEAPRILKPSAFIPLGFLLWNLGDLLGRLSTLVLFLGGGFLRRPVFLLILGFLRIGFIPLYLLCNIQNNGAVIQSDAFYLFVVQLFFGGTNGWLGSICMMDFAKYVEEGEREAAGGFMSLNLVAGLMCGSLLSFAANNVS
jgi:equilibrative nucleoside transporter 1/2/3